MKVIGCKSVWVTDVTSQTAKYKLSKGPFGSASDSLELYMKCNDKLGNCNYEKISSDDRELELFDSGQDIYGYKVIKEDDQIIRIYSSKAPYLHVTRAEALSKVIKGVELAQNHPRNKDYIIKKGEEASLYF